jgi:hypothetical protein
VTGRHRARRGTRPTGWPLRRIATPGPGLATRILAAATAGALLAGVWVALVLAPGGAL